MSADDYAELTDEQWHELLVGAVNQVSGGLDLLGSLLAWGRVRERPMTPEQREDMVNACLRDWWLGLPLMASRLLYGDDEMSIGWQWPTEEPMQVEPRVPDDLSGLDENGGQP